MIKSRFNPVKEASIREFGPLKFSDIAESGKKI